MTEENEEKRNSPGRAMPLTGHLQELRTRIFRSLVCVSVFFVISFAASDWIYRFLVFPLSGIEDMSFTVFTWVEGVAVKLRIALCTALFFSIPFLIYQAFLFVAPGLTPSERSLAVRGLLISSVLFLTGVAVFYLLILPPLVPGLRSFVFDNVREMYNLQENLDFILKMLLRFGIAFQQPVVLYILIRLRLLSVETLESNRRYVIVILLAAAAFLTPQEVLSQLAMTVPLYLMFEITLLTCRWGGKSP